ALGGAGASARGDGGRGGGLVVARLAQAQAEGGKASVLPRDHGGDDAGIHAAREEDTEGDLVGNARLNRLVEARARRADHRRVVGGRRRAGAGAGPGPPVSRRTLPPARDLEHVAPPQPSDAGGGRGRAKPESAAEKKPCAR